MLSGRVDVAEARGDGTASGAGVGTVRRSRGAVVAVVAGAAVVAGTVVVGAGVVAGRVVAGWVVAGGVGRASGRRGRRHGHGRTGAASVTSGPFVLTSVGRPDGESSSPPSDRPVNRNVMAAVATMATTPAATRTPFGTGRLTAAWTASGRDPCRSGVARVARTPARPGGRRSPDGRRRWCRGRRRRLRQGNVDELAVAHDATRRGGGVLDTALRTRPPQLVRTWCNLR